MARSSGGANRKLPNVRFGSKVQRNRHVRFTPQKRTMRQKARLLIGCAILSTVAVRP
jgi:hypothetical protein